MAISKAPSVIVSESLSYANPESQPLRCEYCYPKSKSYPKGRRCKNPKKENSHFCAEHTNEPGVDLEVYKEISARLRHNLDGFWTRSNFFLVVQTGLFATPAALLASQAQQRLAIHVSCIVGVLGLLQALLWFMVTLYNIKYMRLWREQMMKIDKVVDRRRYRSEKEEYAVRHLTPSKLVLGLCVIFIMGWFALLGVLFPLW